MKTIRFRIWMIALVVAAIVLLNGPTVEINETVTLPTLPDNLDTYLHEQEKRFDDITPGTEKTIVWADPIAKAKTDFAIAYIHGFSSSRQELSPTITNVAASLKANLFLTRLAGHGRGGAAMRQSSVQSYVNDAVEALEIAKRLGNKVIIIGNSTGATLATWLANKYPDQIFSLILLSPNYGLKRKESELMLLPWGKYILYLVEGATYSFEPYNDNQKKYWTTQYPSEALLPMMGLIKTVREKSLASISMPLLVIYSPEDNIVDINAIKTVFRQFGSNQKQMIAFHDSKDPQQHILAGEIMSPESTADIQQLLLRFIRDGQVVAYPEKIVNLIVSTL